MGTRDILNEAALEWLGTIGIRIEDVVEKSWPDSDSQVFRLAAIGGRSYYLKQFACSSKFSQAVSAYQNWLGDFEGVVPQFVSANLQGRMLLISDVGDCCCDWQDLSPVQVVNLQFQAGRFLRKLHGVPFVDDDSMEIGDAVLIRARSLQRRIKDAKFSAHSLAGQYMARIVDQVAEIVPLLNRFQRVPCHRDFWRRNWIWTRRSDGGPEDVRLSVLDFEHARSDLFVFDFMKLWSECWLGQPQLGPPFWDGYGRRLSDDERTVLKRCAAIHAVQTIVWATEHQNGEFIAQGQRLLAAAMGEAKEV